MNARLNLTPMAERAAAPLQPLDMRRLRNDRDKLWIGVFGVVAGIGFLIFIFGGH